MASGSPNVIFRLKPQIHALLVEKAKGPENANLLARQIVADALSGESQLDAIQARVMALEESLSALHTDLATAVHVLLMAVHHPDPKAKPEEVAAWVTKNLRTT